MDRLKRIEQIEEEMQAPDFWSDKNRAQTLVRELQELKQNTSAGGYDGGSAVMTIFAGAGGDDAEDFARMLSDMYMRFIEKKGWEIFLLHRNENDHKGIRNITFEINGKGVYGEIKNESGVHRLVRISPFNAKSLRHTSFAMVEVVPKFEKITKEDIPEDEISIDFIRSSGPGGQNVNKRETAVRIVHLPTKLSVHIDSQRSQAQNREKALAILKGKLYRLREEERIQKEKGMYISKTTSAQWGNQIRSYVLHPYKMVKDHRTGVEVSDTEAVLGGEIQDFLEAEKSLYLS
ncbi:MAG: PCRF domain-containing protein [Patescibacteria group bacterium]